MMINETSPFKHLAPYESEDRLSEFNGRSTEGHQLRELYKRSSLIVVHGPSGSGKTSIINCELIGKLNLSLHNIVRLRWHKSKKFREIVQELTKYVDLSEDVVDDLLWLSSIENINAHLKDIQRLEFEKKSIKHLIDQINDYREFNTKDNSNPIIDKFEEKIQDKKSLVVELEISTSDYDNKKLTAKNKLISDFGILAEQNNSPILFLFDQFEEYFVNRSKCYNEIGSFCQLLLNIQLPVKIIFSLRDDYLGNFSKMKKFLPDYDSYKLRIGRLDKNECVNLVQNLFEQFNIECDKKLYDQLFDKIYIDKNKEIIELPYLQVALDSIYQNALKRRKILYEPEWKNKNVLPKMEFTNKDLNIGNVKKIIEKLISRSNDQISLQLKINYSEIFNKLKNQENIGLLFLKQYVSEDRTKITTPYSVDKNNKFLLEYNTPFIKLNANEIIILDNILVDVLFKNRLLNVVKTKQFIELSHDTLAKIIDSIHLEIELLIQKFELEHSIYLNSGNTRSNLLKYNDVKKLNANQSFASSIILNNEKDAIQTNSKKYYWKKSLKKYNKVKKIKYFFYLILPILLMSFIGGEVYKYDKEREIDIEELKSKIELEKLGFSQSHWDKLPQSKKEEYENNFISHPLTSLELPLNENVIEIKSKYHEEEQLIYVRHEKSIIIYTLKSESLNRGGKGEINLFDSLDIALDAFEPININKERYVLLSSGEDLAIKNINKNFIINCKKKNHKEIIDFELINETDNNIQLIALGKDFKNKKALFIIKLKKNNLNEIENIEIRNIEIDSSNTEYILYEGNSIRSIGESLCLKAWDREKNDEGDRQKEDEGEYSPNYSNGVTSLLYLDYKKLNYLDIDQPDYIDSTEHISSFHITDDEKILISYGDIIQNYTLNQSKDSIIYDPDYLVHDNEIGYFKTFDTYGSGRATKYLIGGRKGKCSLMGFENSNRAKVISSLIGHQNEITNVSFLFNSDNVYMTQSADNTMKFWDLRPFDNQTYSYKGVLNITQIETYGDSIFAGFLVNTENPRYNQLIANDTSKLGGDYYSKLNRKLKSNFTSFEKTTNDIIVGTKYNRHLISQQKGITDKRLKSTIHELCLVNKTNIYVACRKGIEVVDYTNQKLRPIKRYLENESFLSIDSNNDNIAAVTTNGKLFVFKSGEEPLSDHGIKISDEQLFRVKFSPSGKYLAMGGQSGELFVYKRDTLELKFEQVNLDLDNASGWITDIAWGANDNLISFSSRDKRVRMFDINENTYRPTFIIHDLPITSLCFGKKKSMNKNYIDENIIYTGDIHGNIKKWNIFKNREEITRRITLGSKKK